MKIYITSVPVADYDKALAFYTEVLGFQMKRDQDLGSGVRFITVVSPEDPDGPELLLEPSAHYPAMQALRKALAEDGMPITSFQVNNLESEYARLRERGVVFTQQPTEVPHAATAVFDDTNGNLIQIVEIKENA